MTTWRVDHGDCLDLLRAMPDASVDAVVTDPPYAEIDRPYGRMTEPEWHALMDSVVVESRRVLKPTGSAVYILQPNSRKIGSMRPWLWKFMAKWSEDWNMIQDVWWWNTTTCPTAHCQRKQGLMRCSLKACVWLGPSSAYRNQDEVLWDASDAMKMVSFENRGRVFRPSGQSTNDSRFAEIVAERGGVTPFNVWPISNGDSTNSGGSVGHGAATPYGLADRWIRYLCPPGGTVLDMFTGSGTMGMAAARTGRSFIGIERDAGYVEIARRRIAEAAARPMLEACK